MWRNHQNFANFFESNFEPIWPANSSLTLSSSLSVASSCRGDVYRPKPCVEAAPSPHESRSVTEDRGAYLAKQLGE
jgi:hypothetical protein